jgi:hypothetical protein
MELTIRHLYWPLSTSFRKQAGKELRGEPFPRGGEVPSVPRQLLYWLHGASVPKRAAKRASSVLVLRSPLFLIGDGIVLNKMVSFLTIRTERPSSQYRRRIAGNSVRRSRRPAEMWSLRWEPGQLKLDREVLARSREAGQRSPFEEPAPSVSYGPLDSTQSGTTSCSSCPPLHTPCTGYLGHPFEKSRPKTKDGRTKPSIF